MTWLLLSTALAGTPLIYDGTTPAEAIALASERTGLPASQLTPIAFRDLITGPPAALGPAVIRHCAQDPVDMTALKTELVRAEAAWRQADAQTTMDHLDLSVAWMSCLSALAEPEVLARLFLLRGALLASFDRSEEALAELSTALAFDPDLSWEPAFPAQGEAILQQARASEIAHRITLTPPGSSSGPWLDGHRVEGSEVAVRSGLHLIQVASTAGIRSAWMVVGEDAALVIPTSYHRSDLATIAGADQGDADRLLTLLVGSLDDLSAAYITRDGGLWLVTMEGDVPHVSELLAPPVETEAPARKWWQRRKR